MALEKFRGKQEARITESQHMKLDRLEELIDLHRSVRSDLGRALAGILRETQPQEARTLSCLVRRAFAY